MKRTLLALVATLLISTGSAATTPQVDLERAKEIVESNCIACHGADGNSAIAIYPKIAGQHIAYLDTHIRQIRDGERNWSLAAAMQPMVTELTDDEIHSLAVYMSKQLPIVGEADPHMNTKLGQLIYRGGIKSQNVPACMSCHGPTGSGMPAASMAKDGVVAFPRITGQHKDYVVNQMNAFRDGSRSHAMMDPIATRMTDEQIEEVANYIQGLH